jgi:hypothetical protein
MSFCIRKEIVLIIAVASGLRVQPSASRTDTTEPQSAKTLSSSEVQELLDRASASMEQKTFRLSTIENPNGPRWAVLMGKHALPKVVQYWDRDEISGYDEYTGRPAVSCDGKPLGAELVIEYGMEEGSKEWKVESRARSDNEPLHPYDQIFSGSPISGLVRTLNGHGARAFDAPYRLSKNTVNPAGTNIQQRLWLDTSTLLPIRWELLADGKPVQYGLDFTYDPTLKLRPPEGIRVPTCVQEE